MDDLKYPPVEYTRCECGYTRCTPWQTCFACARREAGPVREAYRAESAGYRERAVGSIYVEGDPYCDAAIVFVPHLDLFVRVSGEDRRVSHANNASALRDELGAKDTEIKDLLAENARLRRALERGRR